MKKLTNSQRRIICWCVLVPWFIIVSIICPVWVIGGILDLLTRLLGVVEMFWCSYVIPFYYRAVGTSYLLHWATYVSPEEQVERMQGWMRRYYASLNRVRKDSES